MLTFTDDEFVRDRLRWVVDLSNGQTVYEDDGRSDVLPVSAWIRLKTYCQEKGLKITTMRLQFRSNVVHLPSNKPGYFFVRQAFGVWGEEESYDAYVVGYMDEGGPTVSVTRYKVPELTEIGRETRPVDYESPCLIINPL